MTMGRELPGTNRFIGQRRALIEKIRDRGIDDLDLLRRFDEIPRHLFVPQGVWPRAYYDTPLSIGFAQTASQPSLQAHYLRILAPQPDEKVLELGTGSGFLTALLASMADRVYSIDRIRELSNRARKVLDDLSIRNVALMVGDGTIGWRKYAPFDVIVVSAASPSVPPALVDQLADGGRMLIPVGDRQSQKLVLVRREGSTVSQEELEGEVRFVPLLGRFAFQDEG